MFDFTPRDKVTKEQLQDSSQEQLELLVESRVNFMDMRRHTLMAKQGYYRLQEVKPPLNEKQRAWFKEKPITIQKAVWACKVCAEYLEYCDGLKKEKETA
ncbi:hypothetical protein [Limosilactobacillus caecicola]|uniref:hypothetical protein n=1 Tax=Limosilactobacillus caecicola TaxID=2941332 RepID=UPI00203DEA60|nr:hypothetical protein [Limosilactobacillus caecicola]